MPSPSIIKSTCTILPQRWVYVFFGFITFVNIYGIRYSLPITLTQMVVPRKFTNASHHSVNNSATIVSPTSNGFVGEKFNWDDSAQGVLISAIFWGDMISQLPAAMLAERISAKYTLGFGTLAVSLLNALSPYVIWWGGFPAFVGLRFAMGICGGASYPASNYLLSQWIPLEERTRAGVLVFSGAAVGLVYANSMAGTILDHSSWPSVFYFFGISGALWSVFFLALCYDSPEEHPFINEAEVMFLAKKLNEHKHKKPPPAPWKHILTCKPVWALLVITVGDGWFIFTILNNLNKYMSNVLHISIKDNGYLSSVPHMTSYVFSNSFSVLSDWLIGTGRMSTTNARKMAMTLGSVGPAIFLMCASYAGTRKVLFVAMITLAINCFGCAANIIRINVLDLSPNYSGTLMAIQHMFRSSTAVFSALFVGFLTPNQTVEEWRVVFWIVFTILLSTNAWYLVYGSGEVQEWNNPEFLKMGKDVKPKKPDVEMKMIVRTVADDKSSVKV